MKDKILNYIKTWENRCYKNGIPDEIPTRLEQLNKAPSYKQIAKSILLNDIHLEKLGMSKPKCRAYHEIKRAELMAKGKIKTSKQLKLEL
jgi:predicted phosphoadenosine phosphosulfate sulfurtransferase